MARLVVAKCPQCGAGLTIPPAVEWVTCSYCGVSAFIQRPNTPEPTQQPIPTGTPVIHVRTSRSLAWVAFPIVLIAIAVPVGLLQVERTLADVAVRQAPLLFDVNGDGAEDALVSALYTGTPNVHLRALDAHTGATLWKTDSLGSAGGRIALVADTVLFFRATKFLGFDARSGKQRFVQDLPEHVDSVCEHEQRWFLLTEDKKLYSIDPTSGALAPSAPAGILRSVPGRPACTPGWYSSFPDFGRQIRSESSPSGFRVEGVSVSTVLRFGDGALPELALGARTQGSRIPMLAAARDGRTLWKLELPASAPLEVEPGDPTSATIAAGRVYASYERTETAGFTVTSVALSSGQRFWEMAVPRKRNPTRMQMHASERHVFAFADYSLYALSANDGRLLWRIGWDPGS